MKEQGGAHDFGFSATSHAGGSPGEIGGLLWRNPYAYYADRIAKVSMRHKLEAHGRVILEVGAPDSGMFLGWFNSSVRQTDGLHPLKDRSFIGVAIGGPTRVGHYFLPECSIAGVRAVPKRGPIMKQGQVYPWTFLFDPEANNGRGVMRVTLGGEAVEYDFRKARFDPNAEFDRFGLFTLGIGGAQVKVFFDDLAYTVQQ